MDLCVVVEWIRSQRLQSYLFRKHLVLYLSGMKMYVVISLTVCLISCGEATTAELKNEDSVQVADTAPHEVLLGKKADWAYKPDTMVNDLLLGDAAALKKFKRDNGNEGSTINGIRSMSYINSMETEELTVFTLEQISKPVVVGLRVKRNIRDSLSGPPMNYGMARNFVTSSGIYLGMPVNFIQSIYKGQPMTEWINGDTTYLSYAPLEKDKAHFKRYAYSDYTAQYKFVNDACCVYEMFVNAGAFSK
jgi:hypothetical protein